MRSSAPPSYRARHRGPALVTLVALAAMATTALGCDASNGDDGDDIVGEGDPFPDVTVSDCDGNAVALRDWLASHDASYVTFGAGWCVACQEEAPVINRELVDGLSERGDDVGVVQILIENQPDEAPPQSLCADWRDDLQARYAVLVDTRQENLAPFFGGAVGTLPLHLIVTGDGVVRLKKLGAIPTDIQALVEGWLP